MRILVVIVVLCLVSCCATGPAVYGACSPAGLDDALAKACAKWPETCAVGQRLDVFCVSADEIGDVSRCVRDVDACTMWIGSDLARARVYVREGVAVSAAIDHEAQHWHLWESAEGCPSHETSCGWIED